MFERSLLASAAAAVAMSSLLAPPAREMQRAASSRGSKSRPLHGGSCKLTDASSLKKRMRHARRNGDTQPSRAALMRHPWYRRQIAGANLRALVGQPLPGDAELLRAV